MNRQLKNFKNYKYQSYSNFKKSSFHKLLKKAQFLNDMKEIVKEI